MRLISLHGAGHAQQPEHTETGHRAAGQGQPGISRAAETEGPHSRQHPQRHEGDQRRHQGVLPRARCQPGDQSGGGGRQEEAGEDAGKRARPHHGVSAPGRCHAANAGSSIADSIQVHSIATRPAAKPSSAIHSHSDAAAATRPIWWSAWAFWAAPAMAITLSRLITKSAMMMVLIAAAMDVPPFTRAAGRPRLSGTGSTGASVRKRSARHAG
ncbi:hypothetical protein G6F59_015254 [Rhizopus arrhizus]|nr:hypothetical protein G6F59_015254 [Rhizopus arrhizus]